PLALAPREMWQCAVEWARLAQPGGIGSHRANPTVTCLYLGRHPTGRPLPLDSHQCRSWGCREAAGRPFACRFPLLRPDRPIACPRPRPFSPSLCHSHRPARRPLRQSLRPSAPVPHLTTGLRQSWTSELLSPLPAPVLIGSFPSPCLNVSILFGCGHSA